MNRHMSKEESFAQRRKLFKEVWTTGVDGDDQNSNRPKVVKTLNLNDIERSTGKRKKQNIRNLRTVCQDLLEYCDRQEANCSSSRGLKIVKNPVQNIVGMVE
ncbi:uncharacterized protein LOC121728981 isoform X2 [Aricia agestis]|uniref:uncharacterized protein LOC121728981 isoform X2 n=1 Tax=Aricia agestis TaxID=91739 RepID=UPI001C204E92|nr:uncharacterized protein LOC121728981 isoform X2 [Aricia agestis]